MICHLQAVEPEKWVVYFHLSPKGGGVSASLSPGPHQECQCTRMEEHGFSRSIKRANSPFLWLLLLTRPTCIGEGWLLHAADSNANLAETLSRTHPEMLCQLSERP